MRSLLVFIIIAAIAFISLGYLRGWFNFDANAKNNVDIHADKFHQDKDTFKETVGVKSKALKEEVSGLWKKSEGLSGDEKASVQAELNDLQKKHERIEQQIKELENSGQDNYESIKSDLAKSLDDVEKKIAELKKKLERVKN